MTKVDSALKDFYRALNNVKKARIKAEKLIDIELSKSKKSRKK
jgi:hypothetical protein